MKKLTAISLFLFWAFVTAILTAGLLVNEGSILTGTPPANVQTGTSGTLTIQDIAKHATAASCWLLIDGKVYDVTSYLPRHPGGVSAIAPYCGKDGSAAFEGLPHSTNAHQLLAAYLVGAVGQTTTVQQAQPTPAIPAGGKNDDWDDD